jgi:hypothetical protein
LSVARHFTPTVAAASSAATSPNLTAKAGSQPLNSGASSWNLQLKVSTLRCSPHQDGTDGQDHPAPPLPAWSYWALTRPSVRRLLVVWRTWLHP